MYHNKRCIAIPHAQNISSALHTPSPLLPPFSEAALETFFHECLQLSCCGCLTILNQFKTFTLQFWERTKSCMRPDLVNEVDKDPPKCLHNPAFLLDFY